MNVRTSNKSGFTLVEIMIVVAIIGLLAAIAIPNFVKARTTSQKNACINNLRQIDGAVQQWALETKAASTADVTSDNIKPYLKSEVACPSSGTGTPTYFQGYAVTTVNAVPTCTQPASAGHNLPPSF